MKLIIDSGSTKADWICFDDLNNVVESVSTLGLNPEVLTDQDFLDRLKQNSFLQNIKSQVNQIYFYGAGCSLERTKNMVKTLLGVFFSNAKLIEVYEDTYAAVYALLEKGQRGIVCINGTGSNVSYFDGQNVHPLIESLGYMAMDDCSGSSFGRLILKSYFLDLMPKDLQEEFFKTYQVDGDKVKYNFYKQENPNAYMASFLPFLIQHKSHPFFVDIIEKELHYFVKAYLKNHPFEKDCCVNFVGSVAYYLREDFQRILGLYGMEVGKIIQKPLEGLMKFHQ